MNFKITLKQIKYALYAMGLLFLFLFMWEYTAKRNQIDIKPSVFFGYVADCSETLFTNIGILWAKISSYLTFLDFEDLMQTMQDFFTPLWDIVKSPLCICKGYMETALEYKYHIMIPVGSTLLLGLVIFVMEKYFKFNIYNKLLKLGGIFMAYMVPPVVNK